MYSSPMDLLSLYAALDRHPRIPLVTGPTPIRRLSRAFPDAEVWLKDDSSTHPVYGGNKPRKLEYLIARAKAKGQAMLTFGFESSNHAVASVYHCAENDVPCHLILVRGPEGLSPAEEALKEKKMRLVRRLAARIELVETYPAAARAGTRRWLASLGKLRLVPPGGSNPLGTLGYVRAGLELAAQVRSGEAPEPAEIFVPLGTGGTALGLAIGLSAAGLRSRVVAVKVVPGKINELPRLRWLARQVRKLLPAFPTEAFQLANLGIEPGELGAGYGQATEAGLRAVDRFWAGENVRLESTYTGKAAAALEKRVATGARGPLLFWLTYSELRPADSESSR